MLSVLAEALTVRLSGEQESFTLHPRLTISSSEHCSEKEHAEF